MHMNQKRSLSDFIVLSVFIAGIAGCSVSIQPQQIPAPVQTTITPESTTPQQTPVSMQTTDPTGMSEQNINTVKITDKGNLYSVEIPKDWKILMSEGAKGMQLSDMTGESIDWKQYVDENAEGPFSPIYYQSGVSFQFHVNSEEEAPGHYGEGGGPDTGIITTKNIVIGGANGVYHVFKEPSTYEGQLVDAHVNYKGNAYLFRFAYNPASFPQAESLFMTILSSIKFTK